MEILVLALGELLIGPMIFGVTVLTSGLAALVSLVLRLVFLPAEIAVEAAVGQATKKRTTTNEDEQAAPREVVIDPVVLERERAELKRRRARQRKVAFWIGGIGAAAFGLTFAALFAANALFFPQTLRLALGYVRWKTEIAVEFDRASGNLWTGSVRLEGVTVRRPAHPTCRFDLRADRLEIDLSYWSLYSPQGWFDATVFETVNIEKMHGTWEQFGPTRQPTPLAEAEPPKKNGKTARKRKHFRIDRLEMTDIRLDFTDHARPDDPLHVELVIERLDSKPLRSYLALFDVLFRSNLHGTVGGVFYRFEKRDGETRWVCDDLPVAILASYFGKPFDWFEKGAVDILVENRWKGGLTMNWSLVFRDFHVAAPPGTDMKTKLTLAPLLFYMNTHDKRLPLEFELNLKKDDNRFDSSPHWREFARIVIGKELYEAIAKSWKKIETKK